jgi:hypothetical protein
MEHAKKVPFGGEHPIFLHEIDEGSDKLIVSDDAEGSQAWSEPPDESVLSSTTNWQVPDPRPGEEEFGSSSDSRLSVESRYMEKNSRAVGQNRNFGDELVGSAQTSSNEARDQSDKSSESFEKSGPEYDLIPSSSSDDSESDGDIRQRPAEYGQAGQHFQDGDGLVGPMVIDDSDLDPVVSGDIIELCCR